MNSCALQEKFPKNYMSNNKIIRTDSNNPDFRELIKLLDEELQITNGDQHDFFARYNNPESIKHVLILYDGNSPVSCGAIREYSASIAEVKRMYTKPEFRGKGLGKLILNELEKWAVELNYINLVLETAINLKPAVSLYTNHGLLKFPITVNMKK